MLFAYCVQGQIKNNASFQPIQPDSLLQRHHPAPVVAALKAALSASTARTTAAPCNNSTFQLKIPVAAGEQVVLSELQTFPNNNYLAAGTLTLANGTKEGLLMVLSNDGNILAQKRLRINNQPTLISDAKITITGDIFIAGLFADGTQATFIARLKDDLSATWIKTVNETELPIKVTLDLFNLNFIAVAVQLPTSIHYKAFDETGALQWNKKVTPPSLTELVGFATLMSTKLGLVTNSQYNGKPAVQVFDIDMTTGALLTTHIEDNGPDESRAMATTAFNSRLNILGVTQNVGGGYDGFRNNIFSSDKSETVHQYQVPFALNLGVTATMDNAGDALGYFLPASGQLIFIKQFSTSSTTVEFCRQYTVPNASSIAAIARSFDGGFLFGLNTTSSDHILFIKTDSLGILPTCGYQTLNISSTEAALVPNTHIAAFTVNPTITGNNVTVTDIASGYSPAFDCREYLCPKEPLEDSCLSTYYKTFRSPSYADVISKYHLLRGKKQFIATARYDRILGMGNQLTYGMKILDEKGALLKAVSVYNNTSAQSFNTFALDSQYVAIVTNASVNNQARENVTIVDENLQQVWSKTFTNLSGWYASGMGIGDVHRDAEGNYYFVSSSTGFMEKPKAYVFKVDAAGNDLWAKYYEINSNVFLGTICATTTPTSLILVVEGTNGISIRLDKATGQWLNSYAFAKNTDGLMYTRKLVYEAGHILYTGSGAGTSSGSYLLIGHFDTTGRPTKMLMSSDGGSAMRAATARDGHLYVNYNFWNGARYMEALLKVDTALNIIFANEYELERNRLSRGLGVSDGGYIYSGGNYFYGSGASYGEPFLIKYGQAGEVGTCSGSSKPANLSELALNSTPITCTAFTNNHPPASFTLQFLPDQTTFNLGAIVCNTIQECTFLDVLDPGNICQLNTDYTIPFTKDPNCTIKPQWKFDTSIATLQRVNANSVVLRFKKDGQLWIKGKLNTGCKIFEDSVLLTIQKEPSSLSLGKDTVLCPGDSILLKAGTGYAHYTWQDGSTGIELKVKQAGQYFVKVANSCGDEFADTINISLGIIPPLTLGQDIVACIQDTLPLQASPGFTNYNWSPGGILLGQGQQVKVVPYQDTSITVQGITGDGCWAKDTVAIKVLFPQPIRLGADTSFCASDSITLSAGTGYLQYLWSTGSIAATITVKNAGTYSVAAKDPNGCFARDTLRVLQNYALPVVSLGADQDLCAGSPKLFDAGSHASYLWQDGSTNRTFRTNAAGQYWVTVTNSNQCKGSDTIVINKVNPIPAGFLKTIDSICKYGKLTLVPANTYRHYQWSTGATSSSTQIDKPGMYVLTVTDYNGCIGKDTIQVFQKDCLYGVFIPNAFSPNGDRQNDVFRALVFGPTIKFTLQVYNRFGELVFNTSDPDKGWDGTYKGKPCDNGTYIWQCSYHIEGSEPVRRKGHVILVH
jgi:gliding motility-associated-like protein